MARRLSCVRNQRRYWTRNASIWKARGRVRSTHWRNGSGSSYNCRRIQPRSRRALEAAEFARHKGKFDPMHEALFKAFFEKGRNISETAVLLDLAGGVGLNPIDLLGSLEAKEYTPMILGDHKLAARLGIHAVPAMAFHYVNDPVESGVLLTGTRTVSEIEEVVERMKPNAPPPPPPPQPRKRLRR